MSSTVQPTPHPLSAQPTQHHTSTQFTYTPNLFQLTQLHYAHHLQHTNPTSKYKPDQSWTNPNQAGPISAIKNNTQGIL